MRIKLSLMTAIAVGLVLIITAFISYFALNSKYHKDVDNSLTSELMQIKVAIARGDKTPQNKDQRIVFLQYITDQGIILQTFKNTELNIPKDDALKAQKTNQMIWRTINKEKTKIRLLSAPLDNNDSVQIAEDITDGTRMLSQFKIIFLMLIISGLASAAVIGSLLAIPFLKPINELINLTKKISETGDLKQKLTVKQKGEIADLAKNFNLMINRLQKANKELEQSAEAQKQLVADASHELRTPLTSIKTNLEVVLAQKQINQQTLEEILEETLQSTEKLTMLVTDIIDLARGEQEIEQEKEPVNLQTIALEAVKNIKKYYPDIQITTQTQPVTIQGYPDAILRTFNNLLINAAKHSGNNKIDLTITKNKNKTKIIIKDYGKGINENELNKIFDRFYRAKTTASGSGLGLAIVKQAVDMHQGKVYAENENGLKITIIL